MVTFDDEGELGVMMGFQTENATKVNSIKGGKDYVVTVGMDHFLRVSHMVVVVVVVVVVVGCSNPPV